jgi:hypothetical protein
VDLEELEVCLLDILAVAIARCKVCGGPAVVGAVPAFFASAARALVVPVESDIGASWDRSSVGRGRGIDVCNDVRTADLVSNGLKEEVVLW